MNWDTIAFDWNRARAFLVTAEEGSLSAAARALGLTQPTLGRQVSGLEQDLGLTLFDRVGRSLTLTQSGMDLLDHFRTMGEAANQISLAASGRSQTIEGQVSITSTNTVATYFLPEILKRLRDVAPGIEIEVIASNEVRDLRRREADIAIRHVRPEQPELIARLVGQTSAHLYASKEYLQKFGRPTKPEELSDADFIGFEDSERLIPTFKSLGVSLTRQNFKLITTSGTVILAMVRQGLGISPLTRDIAEFYPDLEEVLPTLEPITIPVWLATHRELHTSRRIRLVFDLLAESFSRFDSPYRPGRPA